MLIPDISAGQINRCIAEIGPRTLYLLYKVADITVCIQELLDSCIPIHTELTYSTAVVMMKNCLSVSVHQFACIFCHAADSLRINRNHNGTCLKCRLCLKRSYKSIYSSDHFLAQVVKVKLCTKVCRQLKCIQKFNSHP